MDRIFYWSNDRASSFYFRAQLSFIFSAFFAFRKRVVWSADNLSGLTILQLERLLDNIGGSFVQDGILRGFIFCDLDEVIAWCILVVLRTKLSFDSHLWCVIILLVFVGTLNVPVEDFIVLFWIESFWIFNVYHCRVLLQRAATFFQTMTSVSLCSLNVRISSLAHRCIRKVKVVVVKIHFDWTVPLHSIAVRCIYLVHLIVSKLILRNIQLNFQCQRRSLLWLESIRFFWSIT